MQQVLSAAKMKTQQTLVLIKPDGLVKSLTGNIITSLSEAKLKIVGAKIMKGTKEHMEKHYSDLKQRKPKKPTHEQQDGKFFHLED